VPVTALGEVTVRDLAAADVAAAFRLSRANGWNQTEADWRFLIEENRGRFVAAVRGDALVGTGGAACYSSRLAWVCMILVDAAERGRGVGSALVTAVLDRVHGVETVGLDATPQGRPVYERLGFAATSSLMRMAGPAAEPGRARATTTMTRSVAAGDLEAILGLDREAFGADRSRVIRWAWSQAPALAWCALEEGQLAGYCMGRHGDRAVHIGPVVARSLPVARALVGNAAASVTGRDLMIDVPVHPPAWAASLQDLGLREQRPFTRMYRAGARPPGRPDLILAAFGPELG